MSMPALQSQLHTECSMGDLLLRAIERGGDRVAFVCEDQTLTYRQMGALLSRLVQTLTARGLRHGDAVAALSPNRIEAFLITAAAYVMGLRNTWMHPLASEDDHAYLLQDSGVGTLFFDPVMFEGRARALGGRVDCVKDLLGLGPNAIADDILALAQQHASAPLVSSTTADDICVLIYTGGTTGKPKGVVHTHRTHVSMVMAELSDWDWPHDIRFLAMTPITHGAGAMIMAVLMRSGTYVMAKGFEAQRFFDLVAQHRISATFLVPTMIYVLLDHPGLPQAELASLELIIYGAAPMAPARLIEGMRVFGPVFMQLYGQSEAPNAVTALRKRDHDPERHPQRLASCGLPIYNSQVRLLDEAGREAAAGEVGEICVRGPLVMQGYWNKPEETARALRHGWLYTGDLARRDADGYLYIVGRSKDMIVSGGFNVYPAEIEDVLTAHPAVAAAGVIGVPDPKWGEAVKAIVVLRAGLVATAEELTARVREAKGAVYAPKSIDFVDSLPVTGLGKPDKKVLRERYWQGRERGVN